MNQDGVQEHLRLPKEPKDEHHWDWIVSCPVVPLQLKLASCVVQALTKIVPVDFSLCFTALRKSAGY